MRYKWMPIDGPLEEDAGRIVFSGQASSRNRDAALVFNQSFNGGTIRANVEFPSGIEDSAFEIIYWYDPATTNMLTAGIGGSGSMYSIRYYNRSWVPFVTSGDAANLRPGKRYDIAVTLRGSRISLAIDGVDAVTYELAFTPSPAQVGAWFRGHSDAVLHDYVIERQPGKAFAVMEFGSPYDELYSEVIRPACEAVNLEIARADERHGPGMIITEILRDILDSKVVIAEVSPANPNVYFEVGYAFAMKKPIVLLARKGTSLPFDLRGLRHLFYEDSIGGKARVEETLQKFLEAVLLPRASVDGGAPSGEG